MKTALLYCSLLFAFLLAETTQAQTIIKDSISVNGLMVGNKYTQEQFTQRLGIPTKIRLPEEHDEYLNLYVFYYDKDLFYLIDGEFYGFEIQSNSYTFNNWIKIGDPISKIKQLGGIMRVKENAKIETIYWRPSTIGMFQWTRVTFYYDKNNLIQGIDTFIDDL